MAIDLDIQYACPRRGVPAASSLRKWAAAVHFAGQGRAVVRIVGEEEGAALNGRWRGKEGATNVLSFPLGGVPLDGWHHLGDIIVCAPVVAREAQEQGKTPAAHWAHILVHGLLHLLGHDHLQTAKAERMESLERRILARLGYANPYEQETG